ncbi:MAG: hypothetical protein ACK4UJ_05155 [Leptonema sp. (in: bacteria)]
MPWNWQTNQPYGKYKKLLISKEELQEELLILKPFLQELKEKYQKRFSSDQQVALNFFWIYYSYRNNKNKLFNSKIIKKVSIEEPIQFLKSVRFFRIPDSIRITLLNWFLEKWKIQLLEYNPDSYEMLVFLSKGYRIVTIDWECALNGEFVFGVRDAFEHFLHDLDHCYNFYKEDHLCFEQKKFFQTLLNFYPDVDFFIQKDLQFQKQWEYLISDMNSHPEHLKQYTKAIFYDFFNRYKNHNLTVSVRLKKLLETL